MVATNFVGGRARKTIETIPATTLAGAVKAVPSGIVCYGIEATNFHTSDVSLSGVPLWEDPLFPNAPRLGFIVPASGTYIRELGIEAVSGLRFYSTAGQAGSIRIRIFTE